MSEVHWFIVAHNGANELHVIVGPLPTKEDALLLLPFVRLIDPKTSSTDWLWKYFVLPLERGHLFQPNKEAKWSPGPDHHYL